MSKTLIAVLLLAGCVVGCGRTPIDVPAVNCSSERTPCSAPDINGIITCRTGPACIDQTRILEHDEQNPPKWWCRKVQP
jgi:hypothetical protein